MLDKHGLSQEPVGYWDNKMVFETPALHVNHRATFDPESDSRRAEHKYRRDIKARKEAREKRSREPEWLDDKAQRMAEVLEDMEDVRCELRDAGRLANLYLEAKEHRAGKWFEKETEEEKSMRVMTENACKAIKALE